MNSSEMFNREKKARKLAAALFRARVSVDEAVNATPEEWAMAAQLADCHPPHSKETIGLVVGYLTMAYHDESIKEAAEADDKAEAKWEEQQMMETGADRTPGRE